MTVFLDTLAACGQHEREIEEDVADNCLRGKCRRCVWFACLFWDKRERKEVHIYIYTHTHTVTLIVKSGDDQWSSCFSRLSCTHWHDLHSCSQTEIPVWLTSQGAPFPRGFSHYHCDKLLDEAKRRRLNQWCYYWFFLFFPLFFLFTSYLIYLPLLCYQSRSC